MKKDNLIFAILGLSAICIYTVNCTTQPEFSHYDTKSSATSGVAQARAVQSCAALRKLVAQADSCYGGYDYGGYDYGGYDYGGYDYGGYDYGGYDYGGYDYGGYDSGCTTGAYDPYYGGYEVDCPDYGGYGYGGYDCTSGYDPYYGGYDSTCGYGGYDPSDLIGALNAANARLGCGFSIAPAQCY